MIENYPEKLTSGSYRVRKTFEDAASQVGSYKYLSKAIAKAEENPGTYVFAEDGTVVFPLEEQFPTAVQYTCDNNTTVIGYAKLKTKMNIRGGDALDADIVTVYEQDTIVEVLERCGESWLRIKCEEASGGYAYLCCEGDAFIYGVGEKLHTVASGESVWSIAEDKLGKGIRYTEIRLMNGLPSNIIQVGMKLVLPKATE